MTPTIPPSFLFRFSFRVPRKESLPLTGERLLELSESFRIPWPSRLNDRQLNVAELRAGWNARGLGFQLQCESESAQLRCDPTEPEFSAGMSLWIDTRDTQSIHRAGRFCHCFHMLPTGGGRDRKSPVALAVPIARAREDATVADASRIVLRSEIGRRGWWMECWIPGEILVGFDPVASPRLGFYAVARSSPRKQQSLSVGPEFPYAHDPSLWSTLELRDDGA